MKTVLVTGGSRGIGAETVRIFASKGYTVILNFNNSRQQAERLRNELVSQGYDIHLFGADVSDENQVKAMAQFVERYFKKLDVLVNNAGVALNATLQETTSQQYDKIMNVNAKGTFLVSKYMLPMLLKVDNSSILNVASIWGIEGASCESVYSMSKHAVVGLTKSLAEELSMSNVKVNCVCPPIVLTEMSEQLSESDKQEFCNRYGTKVLSAKEVAKVVYNTALSNESGMIVSPHQCSTICKGD